MKKKIRKILREHWEEQPDKWGLLEMDVRALTDKIIDRHKDNWNGDQYAVIDAIQQIFEGMFEKVYVNEAVESFIGLDDKKRDSSDMIVGDQHYQSWGDEPGYRGTQLPRKVFFQIVHTVVNQVPLEKLEKAKKDFYEMSLLIDPVVKLFGISSNDLYYTASGLGVKIYHTVMENYEGIKNGTITQGSELMIPSIKTYKVVVSEEETEYATYTFTLEIDGYDEDDVWREVEEDEEGEYHWYDYEGSDNFHKEVYDSETRDKTVDNVTEI